MSKKRRLRPPVEIVAVTLRGGSGLIFSGLGWARVEAFGLGLFWLLKFKIWLEAFKSWALTTGLKIKKKYVKFYYISLLKKIWALRV
jgi:hypothetical protein